MQANNELTANEIGSEVMSKSELKRIRALNAQAFEAAFSSQLRSEQKQVLLSGYYMREAYRRRDWSNTHSCFRSYCTRVIKMSDSDFYRKYAIMKTLTELPEIEEKMISGTLNQATVSKAIQFLNKESKLEAREIPLEEKRELFVKLENLTERQVERELSIISPEAAIPDRVRQISADGYRRQLTTDQAFEDKLARLKEILAHSFKGGNPTDCEILNRIADIALEQIDPIKKDERKQKREEQRASHTGKSRTLASKASRELAESAFTGVDSSNNSSKEFDSRSGDSRLVKSRVTNREMITAEMKRSVRKFYDYKCGHINPKTGERCNNRFATEFDHITPIALGGKTTVTNLRLVCRTHNQHYAIEKLGRKTMSQHLKSLNY